MADYTFHCIDGHTAGMPVRLVVKGAPKLVGHNQSERRQHFLDEYDWIRKALMLEPRGHDVMSGALLYPPSSNDFDLGLVFIETSGALPMCGHGTIGSITFALERGLVEPARTGQVRVETPAGLVLAEYDQQGGKVLSVRLINVPSFLMHKDLLFEFEPLGPLTLDIAYGGNFYLIIEPQQHYTDASDYSVPDLCRMGWQLQCLINEAMEVVHPLDTNIRGVKHCMWTGQPVTPGSDGRSVVIAGKSLVDRSPCGTGTSARLAQRVARGWLEIGDRYVHESVIGSQFIGYAAGTTRVGELDAIIPTVEGSAWVTGLNTLFVNEGEPFPEGFRV